jgi:rhamnosyltransferase
VYGPNLSDALDTPRTGAVIVFYNPDVACIERANRLALALHCVVIDNTDLIRSAEELGLSAAIEYRPNGENVGIGTAINQGVEALIAAGFQTAILFDQDSEPPDALLTELPVVIARANAAGEKLALAGPAYEDVRLGGVAPFVRFRPMKLERVAPTGNELIDVDFLITSGSCINLRYWKSIGPMDDALFIDFVDLEWCVRAKRAGYRIVGAPWIRMRHELGGEPVRVLGRAYPMHSPIRHYYLFRNAIALVRRPNLPLSWKSTELVKLPIRLVIYSLMPSQRAEHLKMAVRGIVDGWRGRLGRFNSSVVER